MAITEEELKQILKHPPNHIEATTTLSFDGKNLLTRIPREIVSFIDAKKGQKVQWNVDAKTKEIKIEVTDGTPKEEKD